MMGFYIFVMSAGDHMSRWDNAEKIS